MGCLNCGAELVQLDGKRKKIYCNSTCRSRHFQRKKHLGEMPTTFAKKVKMTKKEVAPKPYKYDPNKVTIVTIKESCPSSLTGLDRTIWIANERKKHNL
jgi:hypothetical protein